MKKLILGCILLSFSLSLSASDSHVNLKEYHKAITKLQNKTASALTHCNNKMECVDSTYDTFIEKREKTLRMKLQLTIRHFRKLAKKTLKKEAKCIKKSPSKVDECFKKYQGDFYDIIASIS